MGAEIYRHSDSSLDNSLLPIQFENIFKILEENKVALKEEGLMTRDPRMVERKKPGQPKARKKFQFSKR